MHRVLLRGVREEAVSQTLEMPILCQTCEKFWNKASDEKRKEVVSIAEHREKQRTLKPGCCSVCNDPW